jgi:antitoxin ParD1/3/4
MNVSLTSELEQFVHEKVKSGRYLSASEVVREALRLLEERDRLYYVRLAELQQHLAIGIEQADRDELMMPMCLLSWKMTLGKLNQINSV